MPKPTVTYYAPGYDQPDVVAAVWNLLCEVDFEFDPPLSVRADTTGLGASPTPDKRGPFDYFFETLAEHLLLTRVGKLPVAMLTFQTGYQHKEIAATDSTAWVTTVATSRPWRNRGLAKDLYGEFEKLPRDLVGDTWTTRTWSTNEVSLRLHEACGYEPIKRVLDERGAEVDGIYLGRHRDRNVPLEPVTSGVDALSL